ncbi:MAG: hypothetical protein ACP5DZ_08745 [Bacteroidales bacterium]
MNKYIIMIGLVFFVFSCQTDKTKIVVDDINNLESISDELINHFKKISICKDIENMGNFKYYKDSIGNEYIEGDGLILMDDEKHNVVFRSPVLKYANNNLTISLSGESCTGINCSKCSFKPRGGCKCEKEGSLLGGASYCNHSISK